MAPANPIRILRIIARLNIGGPAIQAVMLTEDFSKNGYDTLLVCGKVGAHEGDMSYLAQSRGIHPVVLPGLGREISPLRDVGSLRSVAKIIRGFRPHIIHTHTAKAGTLGRLAGIGLNAFRGSGERIRIVHTFHGHVFHHYFGPLKTLVFVQIERFLAKFTDRIIVISPLQEKDISLKYRIAGRPKLSVVRLGFELSPFNDAAGRDAGIRERYFPDAPNEVFLVGIIGRLTHVKNHRMFLDAAGFLKKSGRDHGFRFLVIGDGELRQELARYVQERDLGRLVAFAGWQKEMPLFYRALDVVVLTSLNEGTPVTLIEAMAAGKPVIATDVGGVRDLLHPFDNSESKGYKMAQNGILIPSEQAEILAEALMFLSSNKAVSGRMTGNARSFVLERYSRERLVKDLEGLYRGLLAS